MAVRLTGFSKLNTGKVIISRGSVAEMWQQYDASNDGSSELVFNYSSSSIDRRSAITVLDTNTAIILYGDNRASEGFPETQIIDIVDTTVTLGDTFELDNEDGISFSIDTINGTDAITGWVSNIPSVNDDAEVRIVRNTSGTLSAGNTAILDSVLGNGGETEVIVLTSSIGIAAWRDTFGSSTLEARTVSFSGTTAGLGSVLLVESSAANPQRLGRLSNTDAILGYTFGTAARLRVLQESGGTLSQGSAFDIDSGGSSAFIDLVPIGSDKAFVLYDDSSGQRTAEIVSISGTSISSNTPLAITSGNTPIDLVKVDNTVVLGFQANTVTVFTISGTNITQNQTVTWDPSSDIATGEFFEGKAIDTSRVIISYAKPIAQELRVKVIKI